MRFANIMFILALVLCPSVYAEQAPAEESQATDSYGYYGLEPEIVTNYVTESSRLGYIRVNIELMLEDASNVAIVEHHAPLIRSTIIEILGEQTEERIKSLTGREQIRRLCFETVNNMLEKEVGEPLLVNLLFTKFLYQ